MSKFRIIIAICLIISSFNSCKDENKVTIKGEISNLDYPYVIVTHFSTDVLTVDTLKIGNKGQFNYRTSIDTLTIFTFYFNNYNSSAIVFADKGEKISIKGDATLPDLIQVNGNEINDDLTLFKKENEALLKQRAELLNNMKIDRMENTNQGILSENEKIVRLNSLNHELTQKAEDFVRKNPSKIASVILINNLFRDTENPTTLERVLKYLEGEASNFPLTEDLRMHCNKVKLSAEGAHLPYFQLVDTKNDTIRSIDFSGKYVVLSFLSASDKESKEEINVLKNEYNNLNKDSVQFISIYIDSEKYPITTISNDSIPWITVAEKKSWASDIVKTYNIHYVPYNILISPDGTIKRRNIPAHEVKKAIANGAKWS
ncbi:DUF4369 domain-containing protein [Anaerorudis cellulosivorans]|uniref:DUF4369 domain-containing protein n=1 Tax=Anaerorudis cellulosivorans TaxID=3397862 RepID=UPI0022200ECB|nr:thioredoxin-like domain-containing protein [Seramator thermalis]MCW1735524.1 thioredoxin-like domain-containing protein [Seramator thermalis]HOV70589.1 thioredoxin-like domain-containing protein [Dysgonamonadaceae bacterium]